MVAAPHDFHASQGSQLIRTVRYEADDGDPTTPTVPIDMTGWGARMQIRKNYADLDVGGTPLVDLTIGAGLSFVDASTLLLQIDAPTLSAIPRGNYFYDLEVIPGGDPAQTRKLLTGRFSVDYEVTR